MIKMKPKIYILGDIHGNWRPVRAFHQRNKDDKEYNEAEKVIILLGDAGLNFFFNRRDEDTKKKLGTYPFTYFLVRGNHEERPSICMEKEPDKWHTETYFGNTVYVENEFPYIKYALDEVAIYNINGYKTAIIPGAYSVDKYRRLELSWSWFSAEQLSEQEQSDGIRVFEKEDWNVDLVLSHTCPFTFQPTDLFLSVVDQSTVDATMERYLEQIERNLNYKLWLFGHFHSTRIYPKIEDKQMIMLFNDKAIELENIIHGEEIKFL
jgi:3-oxoacid CoA-transferase subunit A